MVCPFAIAVRVGLAAFVCKMLYDAIVAHQQDTASSKRIDGDGAAAPPTPTTETKTTATATTAAPAPAAAAAAS
ncbi:hypothetical protein NESM_000906800 [Novymonas esmeraldas]|uniref:Uncharacterized protein n=1 Tax=Novymonas esmeraldas TaxID=1808958 RepID=A0AAW0F2A5_9TRYP